MECVKCKLSKQTKSFPKGRNICIKCTKKRKQLWYQKNREKQREYSRLYKLAHPEETKAYSKIHGKLYWEKNKEILKIGNKRRWQENKERYIAIHKKLYLSKSDVYKEDLTKKHKIYMANYVPKLKWEVLAAYSDGNPVCKCCGEKDVRFLSLDHIKNNGAKERRELKKKGYAFYAYLRKRGFPQNGYQVLCYNCNFAKRSYNEVCPHKLT